MISKHVYFYLMGPKRFLTILESILQIGWYLWKVSGDGCHICPCDTVMCSTMSSGYQGQETSVGFLSELFFELLHRDSSFNPLPFICPDDFQFLPSGLFCFPNSCNSQS